MFKVDIIVAVSRKTVSFVFPGFRTWQSTTAENLARGSSEGVFLPKDYSQQKSIPARGICGHCLPFNRLLPKVSGSSTIDYTKSLLNMLLIVSILSSLLLPLLAKEIPESSCPISTISLVGNTR